MGSISTGKISPEAIPASELIQSLTVRIDKMAKYFGRECNVDSDDLRQEAWVAVLEMLPRIESSIGCAEQHLLKRARWRILDVIRRHRRRAHAALSDSEVQSLVYSSDQPDIDMSVLIAQLSPMQRRILRALLNGYTWREAGSFVGCSSANVAYHVRRIRQVYLSLTVDV